LLSIQFISAAAPGAFDRFQRAIAKTRNGQEFYFEQFVNLDELNSFYGDGLRYYFMKNKLRTPRFSVIHCSA
jgi:hypothetical protein